MWTGLGALWLGGLRPHPKTTKEYDMRIGYGKLGRSVPLTLEKCGHLGGDVEAVPILKMLAERHPEHEFLIISRNSGERPEDIGLPSNVINPWVEWGPQLLDMKRSRGVSKLSNSIEKHHLMQQIHNDLTYNTIAYLDEIVMWLGQHGTSNVPIRSIRNPHMYTNPQEFSMHYVAFLTDAMNGFRDVDPTKREEIFLNADARNGIKYRDMNWPITKPVLGQRTESRITKHDREGVHSLHFDHFKQFGTEEREEPFYHWVSSAKTEYARLEINSLIPGTPYGDLIEFNDQWEGRDSFGIFINETRKQVNKDVQRLYVMDTWVKPVQPTWIHGTWSEASKKELGIDIKPVQSLEYFKKFQTVRSTFTTPASGTGWATAKPWEAFAAGVVCFFHPGYDDQDNILGDNPELAEWLRVKSPGELKIRVDYLNQNKSAWQSLVAMQREHFENAVNELTHIKKIEQRLGV